MPLPAKGGMLLLALLIILLVLTCFLLTPLGIDGGYTGGELYLNIKAGPINIKVLPLGKKGFRFLKKRTVKKEEPEEKEEEPEKEKKKTNLRELLDIIKLGLKALGRFRQKLNIDYLRIHCVIASSDPFNTAMKYAAVNAALSAYLPLLDGAFNIRERDYDLSADFLTEKIRFDIWLTATVNLLDLFNIAIAFGIDFLKLRSQQKREEKNHPQPEIERNEANG